MRMLTGLLTACALLTATSAMLAAPDQDRPGQITQAKVWVQNRETGEAVPVSVTAIAGDASVRVQVTGTPTVAVSPTSVVQAQARLVRQPWEYHQVTVLPGQDVVGVLAKMGQDGWDTTGLQFPISSGGTVVLLKRPR